MNIFFAAQLDKSVLHMVEAQGYTSSVAADGDAYAVTIEKDGQAFTRTFDPAAGYPLHAWAREWLGEIGR